MDWMTGQEASETYGYSIAQIDEAAASGACAAEYQGWLPMVAKWPSGPGINEVQHIEISGGPNAGSFLLAYDGELTTPIPYHPSAAQVQDRLKALPNVGVGNVWCTKPTSWGYDCEFQNALGSMDVPTMGWNDSNLVGGSVLVSVVTEGSGTARKTARKAAAKRGGRK